MFDVEFWEIQPDLEDGLLVPQRQMGVVSFSGAAVIAWMRATGRDFHGVTAPAVN